MSGLEVIGGISAVISIIDASIKIYNSAWKDLNLSEAFQLVGRRLPVVLDILQACQAHLESIKDSLPADICDALEKILEACDEKARKLREIIEKVIPGPNDGWEKRYLKLLKRLGNGNKVEELMRSMTEEVQILVNHHAVRSAEPEQNTELTSIINEMKSVKSSVPEDGSSGMHFNSRGGAQTNNVNSQIRQQINNNAAVGTQNFNSGET